MASVACARVRVKRAAPTVHRQKIPLVLREPYTYSVVIAWRAQPVASLPPEA